MATIRVGRRHRYTVVDRAAINDYRLSFKARGLLAWLLDKPDDWRVDSDTIAQAGPDGRDSVRSALRELEAAGYLERVKSQNAQGHWRTETVVRERPGHTGDGFSGVGDETAGQSTGTRETAGGTGDGLSDVGKPGANTKTENRRKRSSPERAAEVIDLDSGSPRRGRRTDPRADTLTREWWEAQDPKPLQEFVAARGIVSTALKRGWDEEAIRSALRHIESPLVKWKLEEQLHRHQAPPQSQRFWEQPNGA